MDHDTGALVAESHRRKLGLFSPSRRRKMNIEILAEGVNSVDIIVVSFIVMEAKRRQRARKRQQRNNQIHIH